MTIHVTHVLAGGVEINLDFTTKDKETHSWFADRPEVVNSIIEAVRLVLVNIEIQNELAKRRNQPT